MNRIDTLYEKWAQIRTEADEAIQLYDTGSHRKGQKQMMQVWQMFQETFAEEEDRREMEGSYEVTMNMLLERIYLELEEAGNEEVLWKFCSRVCEMFRPDEIWREEYAVCIGKLLQKRNQWAECDRWFAECIELEPENPVYAVRWGLCLYERNETERAQVLLRKTLAQYPQCTYQTFGFYRLIRSAFQSLQMEEEAELCRQRIAELDEELLLFDDDE